MSERDIWRFLDGSLPESELDVHEAHLADCDECCARLAQLAELGDEVSDLWPLETPSAGFVDRVMEEIQQVIEQEMQEQAEAPNPVTPLPTRRRSPRFEVFTRFVTAATVTGFMVLGSANMPNVPIVGEIGQSVKDTGIALSNGTKQVYAKLQHLLHELKQ